MKSADKSKVVVVAFPGVQMLDIAGPADVFTLANSFNVEPFYELVSASTAGGATATLNGIDIVTRPIINLPPAGIDTLIAAMARFARGPSPWRNGGCLTAAESPLIGPPLPLWIAITRTSAWKPMRSTCKTVGYGPPAG